MTERAKGWFSEWVKPSIVLQVVCFLLLCGGGIVRLNELERSQEKTQDRLIEIQKSQSITQNELLRATGDAKVELVRFQERIGALGDRLQLVEKFAVDQNQINTGLFTRIAKAGG